MTRRPLRNRVGALLALVSVLALPGCGAFHSGEEAALAGEAVREGLAIPMAGAEYNIFITRQLNLRDAEDQDYVELREPPPGQALYGVFLQVCNTGEQTVSTADEFTVVDTQGNHFEPIPLPRDNIFAYESQPLQAGRCIPDEISIPGNSPTGGALLVFQIPLPAVENRPLELEIEPPRDAVGAKPIKFELDI